MPKECGIIFIQGTGEPLSAHCQATLIPIEHCGARGKPRPCLEKSWGVATLKDEDYQEIFAVCYDCFRALQEARAD